MRNTGSDVENFAPYFLACVGLKGRDQVMLQSAFELRYEVYCLECKYLNLEEYPEGRETDAHDEDSVHFFSHNQRKELAGYVRLVPPDPNGCFPWQLYGQRVHEGVTLPPHAESAEISRLMVRRDYRRRRGDILSGVTTQDEAAPIPGERRMQSPQILLSLYRQMYQHSLSSGIRFWYAAMERPLARSLQRMDFNFRQVGPETDYFGPVAPFIMDLRQMEADVGGSNPSLLAWLQRPDVIDS